MKFKKKYLLIFAGVFLLYLAIHYWPFVSGFIASFFSAAMPIIAGCIIAYVVNILMSFFEKHYFPNTHKKWLAASRRPVCMTVALFTFIGVVILVVALIIPQITECLTTFFSSLPGYINRVIDFLTEHHLLSDKTMESLVSIDWQDKIGQIAMTVVSGVGNLVDVVVSATSSLIAIITNVIFAIIFAVYLLAGKERFGSQLNSLMQHRMRKNVYEKTMNVISVLNDSFHKFIVGQFTEAVILGVLCAIGMLILQLPYAAMIGALIGFTALIPVVGAFLGGAVGVILILMESPVKALIFLIFLIVLQQIEGNLIYPRVVGTSIGLPSVWVLVVVLICGGVFGIGGILFGIPIAATIYKLICANIQKSDSPAVTEPEPEESDTNK